MAHFNLWKYGGVRKETHQEDRKKVKGDKVNEKEGENTHISLFSKVFLKYKLPDSLVIFNARGLIVARRTIKRIDINRWLVRLVDRYR